MTIDEFRRKWGLVFGSLIICELINRIDSNTSLTTAGNELADDLRKLLAVGKSELPADIGAGIGFPRRLERLDIDKGERAVMGIITQRPAPVRDLLLQLLREHDQADGVTTVELAERMGRSTAAINSYLCKLSQYGVVLKIPEYKTGVRRPHELNRWMAK